MIEGGSMIGRGDEAMMLAVREAILAKYPDATCWITSFRPSERAALEALGFRTIRRRQPSQLGRMLDSARAVLGLFPPSTLDPSSVGEAGIRNPMRCTSVVVDVSGFSSSDQLGAAVAMNRWRARCMVTHSGNRMVYMPQAWGPFEDPRVRLFTGLMLRGADLICAREQRSYDYLMSVPFVDRAKVKLAADVAFHFRAAAPEVGRQLLRDQGVTDFEGPLVGISPNMRIYERTAGQGTANAYFDVLRDVVRWFLDETAAQIVLIPHEATYDRPNDTELCQMLTDAFDRNGRIVTVPATASAAGLKAVVGELSFMIASRYHTLVASLSKRVPASVIGWSHKYNELMGSIGIEKWVIDPVREPGHSPAEVIIGAWHQREAIRSAMEAGVPELEASSRSSLDALLGVIEAANAHD
jgi:polysaccharide pyruvyl transferase WcaK-like protein